MSTVHGPSITSAVPSPSTRSDDGMISRFATHSASSTICLIRTGSLLASDAHPEQDQARARAEPEDREHDV